MPISKLPARKILETAMAGLSAAVVAGCMGAPAPTQGPLNSEAPYLVPLADGVEIRPILTVGDAIEGYQLVGRPDGLGAVDNGDGTFTLLVNHELQAAAGAQRAHGSLGAFVSRWVIDGATLEARSGEDLISQVATWNAAAGNWNAPATGVALGNLCSADLAARSAVYNAQDGQGYDGTIYLNGEELGSEGRAFAHLLDGTSYELAALGKLSFENVVANPGSGNGTVVIGLDDSTPGEVYVYVGEKSDLGNPVERAGLAAGELLGIAVDGAPAESREDGIGGSSARFGLSRLGDVSAWSGTQLQSASEAAGVTAFLRPEDGAWDPNDRNVFYFVTTDRYDEVKAGTGNQVGRSRLFRLTFDDIATAHAGGTIEVLLDGTEPHQMFDNMAIDGSGHVLIQEDPGNQAYLARVWQYDIATGALTAIAEHDPERFVAGSPGFLTQAEESSGIIDAQDILGPGWFLLDVQAHYANGPTLVEGGQLLALFIPRA